jgi:WhiB family redox-sensing transcriptional regulator
MLVEASSSPASALRAGQAGTLPGPLIGYARVSRDRPGPHRPTPRPHRPRRWPPNASTSTTGLTGTIRRLRGKPAWHADAACVEHPELAWFPAQGEDTAAAKAVCSTCLVVGECRSWALAQGPQLHGLWGGLSGLERKRRRRPAAQAAKAG